MATATGPVSAPAAAHIGCAPEFDERYAYFFLVKPNVPIPP
jgi:hypothetical protein